MTRLFPKISFYLQKESQSATRGKGHVPKHAAHLLLQSLLENVKNPPNPTRKAKIS